MLKYSPDDSTERQSCTNITVHPDKVIEEGEDFLVIITTFDQAVTIPSPNTTVTILDDTSKLFEEAKAYYKVTPSQ